MKRLLTSLALLLFITGCAYNEATLRGGAGEFKNIEDTSEALLEVRVGGVTDDQGFPDGVYSYSRAHYNDHSSEYVDKGIVTQGVGFGWKGLKLETAVNDKYYIGNLEYVHKVFYGEVFTTITHLDKWKKGNSQTTVNIGTGYEIAEGYTLGAYYKVGNVGAHHVNDIYGAYLRAFF